MAMIDMRDMLRHAYDNAYAVGAFDIVNMAFLEGVIQAAEQTRAPVILNMVETQLTPLQFDLLIAAAEVAAHTASVPVAIHYDHGSSLEKITRGINAGCNGAMIDLATADLEENLRLTRQVVEMAHACGVPVEAELGAIPAANDNEIVPVTDEQHYTTVEEARGFVKRTGVDFLAVSVGTVHGHTQGKVKLDYQRLRQINEALGIPLVIHGGTGLTDDQCRRLVAGGVAKFNYYTALADVAAESIRKQAASSAGYRHLVDDVSSVVAGEAARCLRIWGSAGRAAEVLARCRSWNNVRHMMMFDLDNLDDTAVMATLGQFAVNLRNIPGVREVVPGTSLPGTGKFRYQLELRLTHPMAVDGLRQHGQFRRFNEWLQRYANPERLSLEHVQSAPSSRHEPSLGQVVNCA